MSNIHGIADLGQERRANRGQNRAAAGMAVPPPGRPIGVAAAPARPAPGPPPVNYAEPVISTDETGAGVSLMGPNYPGIPPLSYRLMPWFTMWSFTWIISVIQVIMFIVSLIVGGVKFDGAFVENNSMGGPSGETFHYLGAKWAPDIRNGEVWRLVVPIFLHGGIIHILMNLFFQFRFGFTFEKRWGLYQYIAMYMLTGIGANFLSAIASPDSISVGASGALFGLIGADIPYLVYNWDVTPNNGSEACMLIMLGIMNFMYVIGQSSIDIMAHLGGLISGLFLAPAILPSFAPHADCGTMRYETVYKVTGAILSVGWFLFLALMMWIGPDPRK